MSRKKFVPSETKRPPSITVEQATSRDDKAIVIAVDAITVTTNPRGSVGPLDELKDSIKINGILNPLLVARMEDQFQLLGGHRRLQAAKELGLTHAPCRIVETQEPDTVKLLDNIMREDLNPEDLCLGLKRLLTSFDGNKSALARAVSKSPSYVNRAVKVAELIEAGLFTRAQSNLSLRALFDLASTKDPSAFLGSVAGGTSDGIRKVKSNVSDSGPKRQPSGAVSGGRFANPIKYKETKTGWTLKLLWDAERVPNGTKDRMIEQLEALLQKLRQA